MRFRRFEIRNFKGIGYADIDLMPAGANIFSLIGLNESGKTTLLEAINDFGNSSEEIEALYGATPQGDFAAFVPKHLKANFTGEISIAAEIDFTEPEQEIVAKAVNAALGCALDIGSMPNILKIKRGYIFENSDFKKYVYTWNIRLTGKERGRRKVRPIDISSEIGKMFVAEVQKIMPNIVYFPTFLFAIPDKIYLNKEDGNESDINRHYRQILQDVASSLPSPLDLKTHIVSRVVNEKTIPEQLLSFWLLEPDKQKQINATLNAIGAHLTRTVFESWGKIFSGDFKGREIIVRIGVDNDGGKKYVYLKFVLKDGVTEYDVSERSLGFRWFFSFLLFTLYRVSAKSRGTTLFLLDEPASNLHARAQMQLLSSFAKIASGDNQVMYSTHSHYMINPEWLQQAFVVANHAIDYDDELAAGRPTEIDVQRYRAFVGANPDKTTYYQPVLDKLAVVPSKLDLLRPSVVVEGKGDFFILEYGRRVLLETGADVAVVPTRGAGGMDEIIGLLLGWGVSFAICLDADHAGVAARNRYRFEWGLPDERVFTLEDADPRLKGASIEGMLDASDRELIQRQLSLARPPTKGQILLFFSEALARRDVLPLSEHYRQCVAAVERKIAAVLSPRKVTDRPVNKGGEDSCGGD